MKMLNAHQDMIKQLKVFAATATDKQLYTKKELLMNLLSGKDEEVAASAAAALRVLERELEDRDLL
jgi:plasmid stability protein